MPRSSCSSRPTRRAVIRRARRWRRCRPRWRTCSRRRGRSDDGRRATRRARRLSLCRGRPRERPRQPAERPAARRVAPRGDRPHRHRSRIRLARHAQGRPDGGAPQGAGARVAALSDARAAVPRDAPGDRPHPQSRGPGDGSGRVARRRAVAHPRRARPRCRRSGWDERASPAHPQGVSSLRLEVRRPRARSRALLARADRRGRRSHRADLERRRHRALRAAGRARAHRGLSVRRAARAARGYRGAPRPGEGPGDARAGVRARVGSNRPGAARRCVS